MEKYQSFFLYIFGWHCQKSVQARLSEKYPNPLTFLRQKVKSVRKLTFSVRPFGVLFSSEYIKLFTVKGIQSDRHVLEMIKYEGLIESLFRSFMICLLLSSLCDLVEVPGGTERQTEKGRDSKRVTRLYTP